MHTDSHSGGRAALVDVTAPASQLSHGCPASGLSSAAGTTDEAMEFLRMYYAERGYGGRVGLAERQAEVLEEITLTGSYRHTTEELTFGAKVAWRQSARCIGRVRWAGLRVRDRRDVTTVAGIARELVEHLEVADNGGRIQSVLTVFAPDKPGVGPRARILNDQLIRYCGHRGADGSVTGDPAQVEMTDTAIRLGWSPPAQRSRFDLLPWVIETAAEDPVVVDVPRHAVREVALTHPEHLWFAELGLRWHALPVISNMRLRIGGVDYSCAPFNGHYLSDEIGTRNLGDPGRYDQLGTVAAALGLDTSRETTLWREHAVLVINQAVLHSFGAAGVRVSDPHTESELFLRFCEQEARAGRIAYGDWSWLNGSVGWAALHAVHHRYYDERELPPNIWPTIRGDDRTLRARHDAQQRLED